MVEADKKAFGEMWKSAWELHGKQVTAGMLRIAFAALEPFPLEAISVALTQHVRDRDAGRFPPKPADIIARLTPQKPDNRPDANEAWAMCPRDEHVTVVWTEEMAQAWGVARHLIEEGDITAARMAFRERYEFLVEEARRNGVPPTWTPSLGHDPRGRESALRAAVERGLITAEHAQHLLPGIELGQRPALPRPAQLDALVHDVKKALTA